MKLNPLTATLLAVAAFVLGVFFWFASVGNHIVRLQEGVDSQWAQVENVYQRRSDLIPNLVSTVQGYAKHEASVLEEVTKARASVGQVKESNPADLQKYDQAQSQLSGALSRLLVVSEKYPDLKANQNFLALQSELEGTENRIAVERKRFNDEAKEYNVYLRSFPQSIVAGMKGAQEKPYFTADAGAKTAPKVNFQ